MGAILNLVILALAATAATSAAHAQLTAPAGTFAATQSIPQTSSYVGLQLGKPSPGGTACAATSLFCDTDRPTAVFAGTMLTRNIGAELGYVDLGRFWRGGVETRAQGLNLSLVGRAQLLPSLDVYGKVGTVYGRTDTATLGAGPDGFGLSFGGGVSYAITPQLSATLEWDSHDLRFPGGVRDPVRSTSLGLKYRY